MSLKKLGEETFDFQIEGLEDGGHVHLTCSNCRAILMDIWVTRPNEPEVWRLKATCPFCGDKSFVKEIRGGFYPAGFGKVKSDNPDDVIPSTVIDTSDFDGFSVTFFLKKANENAKPMYS